MKTARAITVVYPLRTTALWVVFLVFTILLDILKTSFFSSHALSSSKSIPRVEASMAGGQILCIVASLLIGLTKAVMLAKVAIAVFVCWYGATDRGKQKSVWFVGA